MSKPTLDIFIGSENLGTVFSEDNTITIKFLDFNIPYTSTGGAIKYNFGGKNRIMVIQGAHDGTGFDGATTDLKIKDFILNMESWVNSNFAGTAVYTDSFGSSYIVAPVSWGWKRSFSDPNRIIYSLILGEAKEV